MSSIPQNYSDEKALVDCIQRFFGSITNFVGFRIPLVATAAHIE